MTEEEFRKIFSNDETGGSLLSDLEPDNALMGLNLIAKYLPSKGIEGADHDIIYSVDIEELVEAGITKEDVTMLHLINWGIEDEFLICFV
jgi:hypothetical protein